jgi:hypothetical protein
VSTLPLTEAVDRAAESLGPDEEVIMKERKHDVRAALRALPNVNALSTGTYDAASRWHDIDVVISVLNRCIPRRMRPFTVPSGSPVNCAMSLWLRPPKYESSIASRCCESCPCPPFLRCARA